MESLKTEVCTDLEKRDGRGRRLLKKEHWTSLMSAYDASGLTQAAFARREGINWMRSFTFAQTQFHELTLKAQAQMPA